MAGRVRVVDTRDLARRDREVFHDSRVRRQIQLSARWPRKLIDIGEGWGILYHSDKWKTEDQYKHLTESTFRQVGQSERSSTWRMLVNASFQMSFDRGGDIRKNASMVEVYQVEGDMPKHVAYLGEYLGLQGILNDGRVVHVEIPGAHWAAARVPGDEDHAVLIAYSSSIHFVVVGPQLGIEKDGIVG